MDRTDSPAVTVEPRGGPNLNGLEWAIYRFLRDNGESSVFRLQHNVGAASLRDIESTCKSLRRDGHIIKTGAVETKYGTPTCGTTRTATLGAKFRASLHISQFRVVG